MDKDKRDELFLQRLLKHQEQTTERKSYAVRRMDLLIISLSGAGIYIIFETLKFLTEKCIYEDLIFLKVGGTSFTLAIIINFFSQWTGLTANKYEYKVSDLDIDECKGDKIDVEKRTKAAKKTNQWNSWTDWSNKTATFLMSLGIVILIAFYLITL